MNWKAQGTEVDEDMAVARTIIEAYPRDGMASAPLNSSGSVRTRTTMNLEPVGAHLKKTISDVSSWLRDRFAVYWDDPNDKGQLVEVATNPNALAFQAEVLASANPGPGDDIRVVWTVANKGKQPVRRISVFLRTTGVSGETQESLVGTLEAGQSRSGSFSAKPPFFPADGVWEVDSGIAVDGWPVALHSRKIEVKIPGRDRPVLSVSSSIVEEKGGVSNGVLDPGEQAKLHVVINNTGTVDVSDLSVTLTNLSGERISLSDSEPGKLSIKGGSVGFVDVPLVFHGGVSADELDVGISLESRALDGPLVQNVTLPVSTIAGRIGSLGGKSAE
jgi:hypothetical protein